MVRQAGFRGGGYAVLIFGQLLGRLKMINKLNPDSAHLRGFLATSASIFALGLGASAMAQPDDAPIPIDVIDEDDIPDADEDRIVVTGSRIRKNSFTSTSPLQTIDAETVADLGLIDIQDVLQNTTVVQGVQLDQQFNANFVSNAGPGGSAVSLRGLGADRTLLLINGRRVAPAGIEGAPSFPDTSILPSSMLQRIDILLDGASSVYGSDAVAGVVNVILRDEFEGVQLDAFRTAPFENAAGTEQRYSIMIGDTGERGSFIVAAEYLHFEEVNGNDRDWMFATDFGPDAFLLPGGGTRELAGPVDFAPFDADGDGTSDSVRRQFGDLTRSQQFAAFPFGGVLTPRPGTANPAFGVFGNFENWDGDGDQLDGPAALIRQGDQFIPEFQRFNVYATSKYDLSDWVEGTEAFFEFNMSNRQSKSESSQAETLDVQVTTSNLFSPFTAFGQTANITFRPFQPFQDENNTELTQYRLFAGLRGDLGFGKLPDWEYELYGGYTRSQGFSERTGLREVEFLRSLEHELDGNGNIVCTEPIANPTAPLASTETLEPCIPFNAFDPGLTPLDGSRPQITGANDPRVIDYLRGVRTIDTFVDEAIISGYFTGPIFDLPAGPVQLLLGGEARETALETRADDVAARGLLSGFFLDRPSNGDVHVWELFGEIFIPVFKDSPLGQNLELEGAGRFTNHEFYGSNFTYSGKMSYSPVDFFTIKSTVGSSFRAPGLRELFLEGQSGFQNVADPCVVPGLAQTDTDMDGVTDTYSPGAPNADGTFANDRRDPQTLANCVAEGIDPVMLGLGITPGSAEVFRAGNIGLDPETSFAFSGGIVFEQPFTDAFDLRFSATYWDIKVKGSVLTPTAQFLVDSCYTSANFPNDPFCTRRVRDPNDMFLSEIDATPFNIAEDKASGIDINMSYNQDFTLGGEAFSVALDTVSTLSRRVNDLTILPGAPAVFDEDAGEIGLPRWRSTATARVNWEDFTLFWQARHIGKQVDELEERPANCFDPTMNIDFARCYTVPHTVFHDTSVAWRKESFTIRVGLNNVFDKAPPQVDEDVGGTLNSRSVPLGVGYDLLGRRVFFNVTANF